MVAQGVAGIGHVELGFGCVHAVRRSRKTRCRAGRVGPAPAPDVKNLGLPRCSSSEADPRQLLGDPPQTMLLLVSCVRCRCLHCV